MMETATYPVEYTTMASSSWRARLRQFPAHTAYLIGGFPLALVSFILGVTLFAAGAGTAIIFIGLPILAAGLLTAGGFAALERRLAEKATGRAMPDPAYHRLGDDAPPLKRLGATLRDPQRWFDLLWVLVHFVLATATFSIAISWIAAALWLPLGPLVNAILDQAIPNRGPSLGGIAGPFSKQVSQAIEYLLAAIALVTAPKVIGGLAALQSSVSNALLCTRGSYEARIDHLLGTRSSAQRAEAQALHRLERDIHDGPQQRLIRLQMDLARAERAADDPERARALIADTRVQLAETLAELRNLSRGIAPPVLLDRGLAAALDQLVARSEVPTTVEAYAGQLPEHIAAAAYFVVAEALTNVNKHSGATGAHVRVERIDDLLTVAVTDNGRGGASLAKGHGLAGLAERVNGVDGDLTIESPPGGPTVVQAFIPCAS